jgi:hypothetical protein
MTRWMRPAEVKTAKAVKASEQENLQAEALHYVDFLLTRRAAEKEDTEWSQCSATQLARQYSPEDTIYDDE